MPNAVTSFFSRFHRTEVDAEGNPLVKVPHTISATRALEMVADGATLVDVRESNEWRSGHAPRAVHIPLAQVASQTRRIPAHLPVVVMCASGSRSAVAARQLRSAGYRATSLSGGITAWQAAGGAVRTGR